MLLYLPWLVVLLGQFRVVENSFWVPPVTWTIILSCFSSPFAHKIWLPPSWTMLIIFYALTLLVIYRNYILRKDRRGTKFVLSVVFTNMNVFSNLKTTDSIGKVLNKDEQFCVASIPFLPFNENNLKQILSESQIMKVDTIVDNKVAYGNSLLLYVLKYNRNKLP